jgi:hypothetical protein
MSVASQVIAYRPLGVLLGGPFIPQRSNKLCAVQPTASRYTQPS